MEMCSEEIIRDYRAAKDKSKQVTILAERNLCTREAIISVLAAGGLDPRELPRSRKKCAVKPIAVAKTAGFTASQNKIIVLALQEYRVKLLCDLDKENARHEERVAEHTNNINDIDVVITSLIENEIKK